MTPVRMFATLVIAASFAVTSCSQRTPVDITPEPAETFPATPADDALVPGSFSPHELLPFAFTPDSSRLAVRWDRGVQFFTLATGQEVASLTVPGAVLSVALSPDGEVLAWSLDDNSIQLVQVSDGAIGHTLIGHPDPVLDLRFSPTEPKLFSASHDGTVRIWDTDTGVQFPPIEVGLDVLGIGLSPDGATLAVVPAYGPVQLWDTITAQQFASLGGTGGYDTSDPVFSPDGNYLAVDLATGIFIWSLPDESEIWNQVANSMAVAYSPDGAYLAYTDIDSNNAVFLGPADAQGEFRIIDEMRGPVWELFFSPDGSMLAATDGVEIRVWRIPEGDRVLIGNRK